MVSEPILEISGEEGDQPLRPAAVELLRAVAQLPECANFDAAIEVSVLLTDDPEIRALNARWRGIDAPTDVLAFPLEEGARLGDVAISLETASRRVNLPHWHLEDELLFLLLHGVLHLLGYDHIEAQDREQMEAQEQALWTILGRGGTLRPSEGAAQQG